LEGRIGSREPALVLGRRRHQYQILLTQYMIECTLQDSGLVLRPEDMIQVTLQHVNARKDALVVFKS